MSTQAVCIQFDYPEIIIQDGKYMSNLVIVESPAKAKTIQKYLGPGFKVVASMGHVRDLYPSTLSVDVKNNFAPKYTIIQGKRPIIKELKDLASKSEKIYLATDPDREGEAISWHLANLLKIKPENELRVRFNEINEQSVKKGIAQPTKIDVNLVNAQQARRILDRLVGYSLSPFISQKIRRGLSAGRVQSVAVRLIVDREEEINAFVPEEYWSISAKLTAPPARKVFKAAFVGDETGKVKIGSKEQADEYLKRLDGANFSVADVKKGVRRRHPAPPFITSTLQQEASKRFGFSAQKTMKLAQELYEGVEIKGIGVTGIITYMRTDSLRISDQARNEGINYIRQTYGEKYIPEKPRFYKSKAGAQDGHEAIRPTASNLTPDRVKDSLSNDQYKLYTLIWKRFIASLMADCQQDTVKVDIKAANESDAAKNRFCLFSMSGYSIRFDGFTVLYDDAAEDEEADEIIPAVSKGDILKLKELNSEQHFTQPPARYTEASLIKMLEETGVGRPSTYATILYTIVNRGYVVKENKSLKPTELGIATTKLLKEWFPKIVNTKFTAGMESKLDDVEAGLFDYIEMLHGFYGEFEETLSKAKENLVGVKIQLEEDKTDIICDKCGRNMVIKVGRFGKFLACPGYPECKNTKPYVQKTSAKCPKCGGDVIAKRSKNGYSFYGCSNYPECNFMTWDQPIDAKCPQCGESLFKARGGIIKCHKEGCGYEQKAERKRKSKNKPEEADE